MTVRLGSAPVSYGVFGDVDTGELPVSPQQLLETMAAAGYVGSELGPPGFFGTPEETARAFAAAGLEVVGAYVPLHLSQSDEVMARDLRAMRQTCEELAVAGGGEALAVLADEGDPGLIANPFRDPSDRERGLDAPRWELAVERLFQARETCRAAGVGVTFHPHYATYVAQAWEIDRLLDSTDLSLCLDTAHFALGGADPVAYAEKWSNRINHVHAKDVHLDVERSARAQGDANMEGWWAGLACPLGDGDLDLSAVMSRLFATEYSGWLVVEQDRELIDRNSWADVNRDQLGNREWLDRRVGKGTAPGSG